MKESYKIDFQKSPSSDFIWRGMTSRDLVARSASRPLRGQKGLFARQAKALTCSKSTYKTERLNTERAEEQPILG